MKKLMTLALISLLISISAVIGYGANVAPSSGTSAKEKMKVFGSPPVALSTTYTAPLTRRSHPSLQTDSSSALPAVIGINHSNLASASTYRGTGHSLPYT